MKPKFLIIPLAAIITSTAMAGQFIWTGAEDSVWTNPDNWNTTTIPTDSTDAFPIPGNTYSSDFLRISNGAGAGALYNPGAGVTTTFRDNGRGIIIGVDSAADLTVSSGTIKVIRVNNTGSEPIMANGVSANLLINGGAIDLTESANNFRLVHTGAVGLTSTMTVTSGSFSATIIDMFVGTASGTSAINLEGGFIAVNRFLKTQVNTPSTINLDGGTLRARNTNANYLNAFGGLSVFANENGGTIDTNGFNITIASPIDTHPDLSGGPDGGLVKTGAGTLTLNGASSFNGGVVINEGRVFLSGNNNAAGTGTIALANTGAEVQIQNGRNFANPFTILDTGGLKTMLFINPSGATLSGDVTIDESTPDNFQIQVNADCFFTLTGQITGNGAAGIHKTNPGWLNLQNPDNDFTGGVKVTGGIVNFDNGSLGSGPVTLDGGTLRWRPGFANEDISDRLVMLDGSTAILSTGNDGVTFVTFENAIGNDTTATLDKQGSGWLTLLEPSTHTGGTTIGNGTLNINPGALGTTGDITMSGGTLRWREGNSEDLSARLVMQNGVNATFSVANAADNVVFANPIGNGTTAPLTKQGGGTLTLTGTQTYTGSTTIQAGTLRLDGSLDAASDVTVEGGALGGSGTVQGSVTLLAGGGIAPGSPTGTLTINGGLDVSAAAEGSGTLSFDLDALAATNDQIAVGGTLVIGGGELGFSDFQFNNLGGLEQGTYTLATSSGISGTLDGDDLSGSIGSFTGTLAIIGDNLVLEVDPGTASGYADWSGGAPFDGDASGDGVSNGIAWVLGATDPAANAIGLLPTIDNTSDPDFLIFTFRRLQDANDDPDTTIAAETSTNLVNWNTATAGPDIEIDITENGAGAGIDLVEVKIRRTLAINGRIFARLNVNQMSVAF